MDAVDIRMANGGVALIPNRDSRAYDDPLHFGIVVAVGKGVPWLEIGSRVIYDPERAVCLTVDRATTSLPLVDRVLWTSDDGGSGKMGVLVEVIDQRHIVATLSDALPFLPEPQAAAARSIG